MDLSCIHLAVQCTYIQIEISTAKDLNSIFGATNSINVRKLGIDKDLIVTANDLSWSSAGP